MPHGPFSRHARPQTSSVLPVQLIYKGSFSWFLLSPCQISSKLGSARSAYLKRLLFMVPSLAMPDLKQARFCPFSLLKKAL